MESTSQSKVWTAKQATIVATFCFLIGLPIGYLANAPAVAKANAPAPTALAMPAAQPAQPEAIAPPISSENVTPEQLQAASKQAAVPLEEQLKKNPKDFKLLVQAGEMYYHHGAYAEAGAYYKRALAVKDEVVVRNQYASTLFYQGDADGALQQYAKVLEKNPKNEIALFNTGMIRYKSKKDFDGAIKSWQTLLKDYPNHPQRDKVQSLIDKASKEKA